MAKEEALQVCIVESNTFFRAGLKSMMTNSPFTVAFEAETVEEALPYLESSKPDLVIAELRDTNGRVPDSFRTLRQTIADRRLVALVAEANTRAMAECLMHDVDGYLMKSARPAVLLQSLALIAEGERVYPAAIVARLLHGGLQTPTVPIDAKRHHLTAREVEILQLLVSGEPNKVIARRLSVTEATVKVHLRSLLRKINAENRTQAAIWALHHGFNQDSSHNTRS